MKKRKTLKWLVVFLAVLLASMFLSRTMQTITTPKIQRISATRGKLEERIPVTAELTFSQGEEVFVKGAKKLNLVVTEVLAQQGYFVKAGDLLARAELPSYQEELDKAQAAYDKAVRELGEHIASQVRLPKDSPHNQLQERYFLSMEAYYNLRVLAEEKAAAIGYELPEDINAWGRPAEPEVTPKPQAMATPSPVPLADMPPEMKDIMQQAFDAWQLSETTFSELRRVFAGTGTVARTPQATFEYIKKIYDLRRAVNTQRDELLALRRQAAGLDEIRAPHSGYLTVFTLKRGDTYDGSKPLYTISKEGEVPSLRAEITDIKKPIQAGTRVEIDGIRQELAVSEVKVEAMQKKYAMVALTEDLISQLGGISKLMGTPPSLTLVYKSARTTALLPASALRTDDDGSNYVYSVDQSWGGLLGNVQFVLTKHPVTVLERSNRLVSVAEDIGYLSIADREDRAIRSGQVVMEYVD